MMKNIKYLAGTLFGLAAFQALANAEMISGTIMNIDPSAGKITLQRIGTHENVTVSVKDRSSIGTLQSGNSVTLNADKKATGDYEAQSVTQASSSASSSASAPPSKSPTGY